MRFSLARTGIQILAVTLGSSLLFAAVCRAQGTNPNFQVGKEQQQDQDQQLKQREMSQSPSNQPAPKVDPKEEAAYKAFFDAGPQDADKRIQLGQDFIQKYPSSVYVEAVHAGLAQAYYTKQDWKNFYADADKALALKPDDVDLLTMVGWVIPHVITGNESDAGEQLDKAETYEKRAMQLIPTLPKPANITDDQFAALKAEKLVEAHSGLGLVYFRRQDNDNAIKELQQATQGNSKPDPTDLFVLGASLQNLGRYTEAADAFTHCSQIAGSLQDRCKQNADNAKKLAPQKK
jgi:tetratricopeptide (TPR) repeat protein